MRTNGPRVEIVVYAAPGRTGAVGYQTTLLGEDGTILDDYTISADAVPFNRLFFPGQATHIWKARAAAREAARNIFRRHYGRDTAGAGLSWADMEVEE